MTHGPGQGMQKEISLVSNTAIPLRPPLPLPSPSRPSQPENGLTNDDESSRVLSRGLEHICLEAGCRVVVLNPVGLSTRIHNSHTTTTTTNATDHLSLPPLPSSHSSSSNCRSSSILRDGGPPPSVSPFIVILGPARIRLDAPLKDALALLTKDSLIYYAY